MSLDHLAIMNTDSKETNTGITFANGGITMKKTLALLAAGITFMAGQTFAQPAAAPADKPYSIVQRAKVGGGGRL
jgi:hypothetical protein